jgi:hypothetical protein
MELEIKKVEDQIEEASEKVRGLFALKNAGSFDSEREKELQYWIKEQHDLRKKAEDLRKKDEDLRKEKQDLRTKELILLEISKNELESKASFSSLQCS